MSTPITTPGQDTATFTYNGKSYDLPVVRGSEGELAIDVERLRGASGLITLDPGYGNTGACKSAITFIDGEKGILRYRGYPIEDLALKSSFLESAWLLLRGELPTRMELEKFQIDVKRESMLHESFRRFFDSLPKDAHPMPVCSAAVSALATFYQEPESDRAIQVSIARLIGKMPTIAAYSYKHSIGEPLIYPQSRYDYASNFLHMMFSSPCCEDYEPDPVLSRALDLVFLLHADHEQNCSTSTVRMVGSSRANLYASIAAGIGALWGPLHGGANQAVIHMLERIVEEEGSAEKFIAKAKDKNDTSRLMGFGHRVYKSYDPRAKIIKEACQSVIAKVGMSSRLLEIALKLEEIALHDEYFVSRKLYPNVDFYSGLIFKALRIPDDMYTVMFTIGRMPGWIAQWLEMKRDPERIARPRQLYIGETKRSYVSMPERG